MAGTTVKKYDVLTLAEAQNMCLRLLDSEVVDDMTNVEMLTYAELVMVHRRIDEIENQAQEMMSPDAMMDMATKFLGGGMPMG